MSFFHTADGGDSWQPTFTFSLPADSTEVAALFDGLNSDEWLILPPLRHQLLRWTAFTGESTLIGQESWLTGLTALDMAGTTAGWAGYATGECRPQPDEASLRRCLRETRLLRTQDGGRTWTPLFLPGSDSAGRLMQEALVNAGPLSVAGLVRPANGSETSVFIGHGFDKCEVASLGQLQTWFNASPYRVVNLYIGGVSRYCANTALSATLIAQLSQQGWYFIPTWVGPQAACTGYTWRMSSDLATAYNQGLAEATAAIAVAANLGLTRPDHSGTIIYYDLEYFDATNTACHNAARAFIAGWTAQLRGTNNLAGVYSNGPILNGFADIPNVPDAIWPAHWLYSGYNPAATVWNVYQLSNSLWSNQQRIRQYTGGHNESWGGLTLNIDSDVIAGIVAGPHRQKFYLPLILHE
jgi:hypothetical protein